jgi:hypothetical protein
MKDYSSPSLRLLTVYCEAGFAQSVNIDGLTPEEGQWDPAN